MDVRRERIFFLLKFQDSRSKKLCIGLKEMSEEYHLKVKSIIGELLDDAANMNGQYKDVENYIKQNACNAGAHITFSIINPF